MIPIEHQSDLRGVALTKDAALFRRASEIGKQVIAWQTYAERFPENIGTTQGNVPRGSATLAGAISDDPDEYPQSFATELPVPTDAERKAPTFGPVQQMGLEL